MNTILEQTEKTDISFGNRLRQAREALNLSLEDAAKAISPKKCAINFYERICS